MARKSKAKQRPFQPGVLASFVAPYLKPRMGPGEALWRFTITIPLEEIRPRKLQKATPEDLDHLQQLFGRDFGGYTQFPNSFGYGMRDPSDANALPEMNYNTAFAVLTTPIPEADAYFRALRAELESAFDEGVIQIERQDVWIP